jgi:signal transduction histidine kinase
VEVDREIPLMEMDRTLLRQAIHNLVKNGMEALSRGGALTISSRLRGEQVEIAVSDTGPGISQEVGDRLFEPFFTTKPQGTGLGLSIARQITDEHGGELSWESRPGAGTTFVIRVPLKRAARV